MLNKTIQLCAVLIALAPFLHAGSCRVDGSTKSEAYEGGPIIGTEYCGTTVKDHWIARESVGCGGMFCVTSGCHINDGEFHDLTHHVNKVLADSLYTDCKAGKLPIIEVYSATADSDDNGWITPHTEEGKGKI